MATLTAETKLPKNDPLLDPTLKSTIDQIIDENIYPPGRHDGGLERAPGKDRFYLRIHAGLRCQPVTGPGFAGTRCGFFLFFLHHYPARQTRRQILHGNCLLCRRNTRVD